MLLPPCCVTDFVSYLAASGATVCSELFRRLARRIRRPTADRGEVPRRRAAPRRDQTTVFGAPSTGTRA